MANVIIMHGVPCARNYEQAYELWEKSKPHKQIGGQDQRIWDKRKDNILKIVKANETIAFRYHVTDVVTYYPDGRVGVRGWDSLSTNKVMECCLPDGMAPDMRNAFGTAMRCMRGPQDKEKPLYERDEWTPADAEIPARWHPTRSWRWDGDAEVYLLKSGEVLFDQADGEWYPCNAFSLDTFDNYRLDQAKLRAYRKQFPLSDFFAWAKGMLASKGPVEREIGEYPDVKIIEFLQDQEKWQQLLEADYGYLPKKEWYSITRPYTFKEGIDRALLRLSGAVTCEQRDSVHASELPALLRRKKKYEECVQ